MADGHEQPKKRPQQKALLSSSSPSSVSWERLPDDLWHHILTHLVLRPHHPYRPLRSVSLVCKRFLALSNRTVTFFSITPSMKPVPLPTLLSRFPNVTSFKLGHDPDLNASLTLLAESGLPLQSLHLSDHTHFPKDAMRLLAHRMSGTLKSLSCVEFDIITDDDLALVAGCFPYLKQFEIGRRCNLNYVITDEGILEFSTKLKSLVSVNIWNLNYLTHRSLEYLLSNCPSLRNLRFGLSGFNNYIDMDQFRRFHLFQSLSALHLELAKLSRKVLVRLSKVGLKLEKLILDEPLINTDVTGEILCGFFKSCPSLRRLQLSYFSFPADTNAIDFASSLPNIQVVAFYSRANHTIPPATLLYLLRKCPLLEEIVITSSFLGITQDWFNNTSAKYLVRKLDLFHCNDLCDETLKLLVSVCPKLEALRLMGCSKTTRKGIEAVAASCSTIKFLYATGCQNFQFFKLDRRDQVLEQ